ncbi:Ubiquitin thioesterase otubain-like protein [Carex littledalei]|uniref:ubiquitinyl hydrolase 1 n=1 Tax=Carex littledalei TaxID=544730 RepID=A0A833RQU7_9POAL|nr:Ubiquitin thioesterase otubain-like protein [Carex littledalei]
MEGASAAAASSGCDYDEFQPQKKIPMVDAFSAPSTSNTNPSSEPSFVPSLEKEGNTIGFNDDSMQGVEKQMTPFVGGKHDIPMVMASGFEKPFVSDKEPLSALAAEFESGSPIIQEKIKLLGEKYTALRRTRGDGNCFYRSFMFSYLEHILVTENRAELDRVLVNIEQCRVDLFNLGYAEFTYEDFFGSFTELLEGCLPGTKASLSLTELLEKACDQITSNCVSCFSSPAVMFLRFVTSAAIQKRAEFFQPFVTAASRKSVVQFCKLCVEPMGEESDHVHITALCDALGVPIRVAYIDARASSNPANPNAPIIFDFFPYNQEEVQNNGSNCTDAANVSTDLSKQENPAPLVTLLYRPGHYDILYPL